MECKSYDKWQAQEDAYSLKRAEEVKNDPSRLSNVRQYVAEEKANLEKVSKVLPNTRSGNKATVGKLKYK